MTPQDRPAFARLLAGLAEVFDVTMTPTRVELYFRALDDLDLESVQHAAGASLRQHRFFPKPAELRALTGDLAIESAEHAWLRLMEAFHEGVLQTIMPDDPITAALVRVYWGSANRARSWWNTCHDAALEAKHREFVARYQEYARRPAHELPRLPGGLNDLLALP